MLNDLNTLFNDQDDTFCNKKVLISESINKIFSIPFNYVGNKKRILIHISELINKYNINFKRVVDPFSGSGVVSLFFNLIGYPTISNDILTSSSIPILSLIKGKKIEIKQDELDYIFSNNADLLTDFVRKNYNMFFNEKESLFLDKCKSNIVHLVGNEMAVSDFKSLPIIPSCEKEKGHRNFEENLKGTILLFLLEKAIMDICFVGGRYYNGQIIAKLEHRLSHNKNQNRDLESMLIKKIKWMYSIYEKSFCFNESFVYNNDVNYLLEQVLSDNNNDTLVYLDPPYGGNSSDYSHLYKFLEEYLYEDKIENLEHIKQSGNKFKNKKEYDENFCNVLNKCFNAKYLLISFNASSFNTIEHICEIIKKYRKNIFVKSIPIAYNYRKDRTNFEYVEKIFETNGEEIKIQNSEREFLILAY